MKTINSKRSSLFAGKAARRVLVIAAAFALALSALAFAGCSCSAQSSASASASSSSASASASSASSDQVSVPNLVGLKRADAEKQIKDAGLAVGKVGLEYSDTVAEGLVISQKPAAMTKAASGTKIDLTVSQGKKAPAQVAVPKLIGMSQSEAEKALADAKLVAVVGDPVESTDVEPGKVCKQSVTAGTMVEEGSKVTFSTALAKQNVTVPDVVGKSLADAKAELDKIGLGCDTSTVYSDSVDKDSIVSQSVTAGTSVTKGTVIVLQVSLGKKPVQKVVVPDILTYTLSDATSALESAGLSYRYGGDEDGTVVAVDPAVGTEVEVGSSVAFTLQKQVKTVSVPDVSGMSGFDADDAMDDAGLVLDYDSNQPDKALSGTNPAAGTVVEVGSTVVGEYPPDPEPVGWKDASSAADACSKAGVDGFDVDGSVSFGDLTYSSPHFQYQKGMVAAIYEAPASQLVIRKGTGVSRAALTEGLGSYASSWTQNFKGLEITCSGNAKDAATLLEWGFGGDSFSAALLGLGGETMSMDPDDVASLVAGIQ